MQGMRGLCIVLSITLGTTNATCQAPGPAMLPIAAAYAAKVAASAIFVSGRTLESVLAEELAPTRPLEAAIRPLLKFEVDTERRLVTCRIGKATATAVATGNLGCTLVRQDAPLALLQQRAAPPIAGQRPDPTTTDWPLGDRLPTSPPTGIDLVALQAAIDAAFVEPQGKPAIATRAIVVLHQGRLVAERYAQGYQAAMPLPGWSMSKTLTHALLGRRIQQGKLDPKAALPVPEWRAETDARRAIGMADLLAMCGGLRWNEAYDQPESDALRMLFGSSDHAATYAGQAVATAPGTEFLYSSGATNLLCRVLRTTFPEDREYWAFPRTSLFEPLGMHTAVLETDPAGTFVGSSYGFASARDWARFGQLYCDDGVVAGERLLPSGWIDAARIPHGKGNGSHGSHLWLNADPDGDGPLQREWPDLPADLLSMDGHEGQYCVVFPRERMVIVRLGCTKNGGFGLHALLRDVLRARRAD